ncbi:MAG: hypothetical protein A3F74_24800 [Betaproteobacteria bacterium RIFCSPLOWO2_12_FULL_62_58]|nr:MAG: hypothetical protein A3F74_24800 [Betaproteobacteria bacterium RIFCSPLOWO2_12_FULL_62_58]
MKLFRTCHSTWRAQGCIGLAVLFMVTGYGAAFAQEWRPKDNVEIVVPNTPGGGNDSVARLIQRILQDGKLVETTSTVVNKPGGGGNVTLAYIGPKAGDAHYLGIASITLQLNHITGRSQYRYSDFTPIANMIGDYVTFAVRADSDLKTAKDLLDTLKKDPASLAVGVTAVGGANHIPLVFVAKAAGSDARKARTPVFQSTSESVSALLGGHIDMILSSVAIVAPHVEAGRIRVLAVTSGKRVGGVLAQAPTWKEVGVDVEFSNWRGLIGPKGLTPAQVAYWDDRLGKVVASDEWKATVEKRLWANEYMNSKEIRAYLERTDAQLRTALTDLGLAK